MPAAKRMKLLLPIKTSKGLFVPQSREEEEEDRKIAEGSSADEGAASNEENREEVDSESENQALDEANDAMDEDAEAAESQLTPVEQMALEEARAKEVKITIANYAQSVIENPQENVANLRHLRLLLSDPVCRARPVLADYVVVSLCEVFKDILPAYRIRLATDTEKHQLARKETRRLRAYEEALLSGYRKYLALLRDTMRLGGRRKRGRKRQTEEAAFSNRFLAVRCLSQLLGSHPNFNESPELIARLTPCLNSRSQPVSAAAAAAFRQLFAEDRSGEATLLAVKSVCRFASAVAAAPGKAVHAELLETLAYVRLDLPPPSTASAASGASAKEAQFNRMTHKEKQARLSRQERKRGKRTASEAAGLEELRGQESANVRARRQQRCAELLLNLYVRLLRSRPGARPLAAALAGLNRLALRVNLELLPDLFRALGDLLEWPDLAAAHSLQVVSTALALLTGEGEALTLDPRRFYLHLYARLDRLVRCHPELSGQLADTLRLALADRRRHLPPRRPVSFLRRLLVACCAAADSGAAGEPALVDLLTCAGRLFAIFPRAHYLLEPDADSESPSSYSSSMAVTPTLAEADPDLGGGPGLDSCVPALRRLSVQHASARVRQLAGRLLRLDFGGFPAAAGATPERQAAAEDVEGNDAAAAAAATAAPRRAFGGVKAGRGGRGRSRGGGRSQRGSGAGRGRRRT